MINIIVGVNSCDYDMLISPSYINYIKFTNDYQATMELKNDDNIYFIELWKNVGTNDSRNLKQIINYKLAKESND